MGCVTKTLIGGLSVTGVLAIVFIVLYATKGGDICDCDQKEPEQWSFGKLFFCFYF